MGRILFGLAAFLATTSALQAGEAQNANETWNTAVLAPSNIALAPVGFPFPSGAVFVPSVFSEVGYDSNPNQTFNDRQGSAFVRSGAGFNLSRVTPDMVANLKAAGSVLSYFNNNIFDDLERYAGAASGNITYLIEPGVTGSSGAFINYDGQSVNRNQAAGANSELAYGDALISNVLRTSILDVQYFGTGLIASPISLTSAFNYIRTEGTYTGLLGKNWAVAPYVELSTARVDYTDQPAPALVDRSANDYHAKTGVRWTASPTLTADIGWRFNERNTQDRFVPSYSSNFFDGGLVWRPSPFFAFQASVERFIGEPSTNFAILADVRSYSLKSTYLPVPGVSVTAGGGWLVVNDIGSGVHYQAPFANAQVDWAYNSNVHFYTALQYQGYELDWQALSYNDVRVMAGVRIVPDGQNLLEGESVESLLARLADAHRPLNSELSISGGYSWFGLPDQKMVTIVGGPLFNQAVGQETSGDGSLNGWRTDVRLANFAEGSTPDGRLASFGLSGFFANYQGSTSSHCMYSLTTDCAIVNIADFNSTLPNNTGPFGNLFVSTDRNVNYWGVAVDLRMGWWGEGGSKDGSPVKDLSPYKFGVAVRGIDQTTKLSSIDPLIPDPVKYKETLDTHYYGGYVGVEGKRSLGDGWIASIDATAGLYYTDTEYQGRYNGYAPILTNGYFQETGFANLSMERGSFIGSLRLDMKRQLSWGAVGVFGKGEYLSYVPQILYNNNDLGTGVIWGGIKGDQIGTKIGSSDAFNFMTGLDVSVALN